MEELSFTSVPILFLPWDQQGPGNAAVYSPCPIYLLSLYEIHNKWFSLNFSPSIFSTEFRLDLTISSEWFCNVCLYILLFLPRTQSDEGRVSVIPYPSLKLHPLSISLKTKRCVRFPVGFDCKNSGGWDWHLSSSDLSPFKTECIFLSWCAYCQLNLNKKARYAACQVDGIKAKFTGFASGVSDATLESHHFGI